MPFGLTMSQDVFQMQMDQITDSLSGIIVIHDDICMYGKDTAEHDKNFYNSCRQLQNKVQSSRAVSVPYGNLKSSFMALYSQMH